VAQDSHMPAELLELAHALTIARLALI